METASSSQTLTVTDETFKQQVLESKQPVLVDFWAPWCGPCQMLAPILDELAQETAGKFLVKKIDIDQNAQSAHAYNVKSIPTLIIFKDGKEVDRLSGTQTKATLQARIATHLGENK